MATLNGDLYNDGVNDFYVSRQYIEVENSLLDSGLAQSRYDSALALEAAAQSDVDDQQAIADTATTNHSTAQTDLSDARAAYQAAIDAFDYGDVPASNAVLLAAQEDVDDAVAAYDSTLSTLDAEKSTLTGLQNVLFAIQADMSNALADKTAADTRGTDAIAIIDDAILLGYEPDETVSASARAAYEGEIA